jgi:hypothetical protein
MYGTHTLAFQRIFVRMNIIALIFIRFSYVSLIRNSVTGPLSRLLKRVHTLIFGFLLLFSDLFSILIVL